MQEQKNYEVHDVFTPSTAAKLAFIDRDEVNEQLVDALRTPGKQIVVYGYSGSGKTTLLRNKLRQLYSHEIITRCTGSDSFEQLMGMAFDDLNAYYVSEFSSKSGSTISASASSLLSGIKAQLSASTLSESSDKKTRIIPPQMTAQNLAKLMGEAKCCWVLEDFHKVAESERVKLSQAMKVFMDMAEEYREVKVIAIGAVDTARQVVQYDPEMRTRIAEIYVPLMEPHELQEIVNIGTKLLQIRFSSTLTSQISHYANGLPSVCHTLCLNICLSNDIESTATTPISLRPDQLQPALNRYLLSTSDSTKMAFETSLRKTGHTKHNNALLIIQALAMLPQEGATKLEIIAKIRKDLPKYPSQSFKAAMIKLCAIKPTPLIRTNEDSGKYSFIDPVYRVYAMTLNSEN